MDMNLPPSQLLDPYSHGLASGYNDIFSPFLGPAPRQEAKSSYSKKNNSKWNMPEVYVGKNEYLGETVEDWMLTANQTWYTERIMPWLRTDNIHIRWTQWEYNPHYMGITPHQSMSNVVDSRRTARAASMVRRGIAVEFEDDFVATDEGRTRFMGSVMQVARSVQETANVEVLRALMGCHRYQHEYERRYGILAAEELDAFLDRRVARFMIAQKEPHGLETLNTQIDEVLEKWQGKANTWILGREVMDYCDLAPNRVYYDMAGQEGVDRLNGRQIGPAAAGNTMGNVDSLAALRVIKDTPVYLAKSYHVDGVGHAELLSREMELGVYNTMVDRCRNYNEYTTASRAIRVYDNDTDDWAVISLEDAIEHCVLFDEGDGEGEVYDPFTGSNYQRRRTASDNTIEAQNDFLRFSVAGDKVNNVKYIGDLDEKWMTTKQMLDAGQTLLNAINRTRAQPLDQTASVQTINGIDLNPILGDNSLFANARRPTGNKIADVNNYRVTARSGNNADIESNIDGSAAEERHQKLFEDALLKSLPDGPKRIQARAITGDATKSWKERAQAVKDIAHETFRSAPQTLAKGLQGEERINSWFDGRINEYEQRFNDWAATRSSGAASSSTDGSNIREVPIGQPLPEGCSYLNDYERQKAQAGVRSVPTSLRDFTGCPQLFVGNNSGTGSSDSSSAFGRRRGGALIGSNVENKANKYSGELDVRFNNIEKRIKAIANSSAPAAVRYLAMLYLGARFSKRRFLEFARADIYVPAGFLLLRPHATYRTRYGIKCQAGECGNTFFGHGDMQLGNEATRKVGVMHYTTYLSAVVTDERKVYVVQDIFCKKYLGGMGTTFWSRKDYTSKGSNRRRFSIVCTMLPPNFGSRNGKLDKRIDVRGQFYTHYAMKMIGADRFQNVCYPGAGRTAAAMGWWDPIRQGKGNNVSQRSRHIDMNFICSQAVQFHYNNKTDAWGDVIVEQSEFGEKVYPGCGRVRNGEYKYLKEPSYLGLTGNLR